MDSSAGQSSIDYCRLEMAKETCHTTCPPPNMGTSAFLGIRMASASDIRRTITKKVLRKLRKMKTATVRPDDESISHAYRLIRNVPQSLHQSSITKCPVQAETRAAHAKKELMNTLISTCFQSSVFDPDAEVWLPRNMKCLGVNFSDDGAPETSQLTMSIGSITLWNFGERPSADMSWQSWACNELNQAATYPSPYANVNKNDMCTLGGTIGLDANDTWTPYTNVLRTEHVKKHLLDLIYTPVGLERQILLLLKNASGLFNKINLSSLGEVDQLTEFCQLYFNILVLFFPSSINITVWTVGYAIPYHTKKLYEEYKVGYGILSLQAKESKHAGIKGDLCLTNRSNKSTTEHQLAPPSIIAYCVCGRTKDIVDEHCPFEKTRLKSLSTS
ncbi:Hypothetical predicted protein, partial [Paramuricea clavata]